MMRSAFSKINAVSYPATRGCTPLFFSKESQHSQPVAQNQTTHFSKENKNHPSQKHPDVRIAVAKIQAQAAIEAATINANAAVEAASAEARATNEQAKATVSASKIGFFTATFGLAGGVLLWWFQENFKKYLDLKMIAEKVTEQVNEEKEKARIVWESKLDDENSLSFGTLHRIKELESKLIIADKFAKNLCKDKACIKEYNETKQQQELEALKEPPQDGNSFNAFLSHSRRALASKFSTADSTVKKLCGSDDNKLKAYDQAKKEAEEDLSSKVEQNVSFLFKRP